MKAFTDDAPQIEDPFRRILIVDDEPRIVDFVSRGLRREGFEVGAHDPSRGVGPPPGHPLAAGPFGEDRFGR